ASEIYILIDLRRRIDLDETVRGQDRAREVGVTSRHLDIDFAFTAARLQNRAGGCDACAGAQPDDAAGEEVAAADVDQPLRGLDGHTLATFVIAGTRRNIASAREYRQRLTSDQ